MKITDILCRMHQKEHAHLVGNATVGIYLSLRSLDVINKRVAIPNSICPNVPLAVLFSGNTPIFLDISNTNLGLMTEVLLNRVNDFDAVIANHSYGSICDIEAIKSFCHLNGKIFIEDFAVAQGGMCGDKPVGSFGDVSVVSFGAGKIVSIGHGGAVLTNDFSLMNEIKKMEEGFADFSQMNEVGTVELAKYYRKLYNESYGQKNWQNDTSFYKLAKEKKQAYFHRFSDSYEPILQNKLEGISDNVMERARKAEFLSELIRNENTDGLRMFEPPEGSVYWRYSIFLEKNRNELLKTLLKKGYRVSSWYPSCNVLFREGSVHAPTPNSDRLSDEIINIWVNDEVDENYLRRIVKEITDHNNSGLS